MDLLKGTVMNGKKCICIVLDSVGIGALPDASRFGDEGSHTLLHVMQAGYPLPNLCAMGLANIDECRLPGKVESPKGCYGKAAEPFQGYHRRALGNCGVGFGQAVSHISARIPETLHPRI